MSLSAAPPIHASRPAPWGRDLLLLALFFGLLLALGLGRAPFASHDEGRYAEIPREMLAAHDFVTPRLDGVNYFEKPPLMYWLVAADLALFGPREGALRAVPALFALGGVLLTYAATRRIYGREAGLIAGVVLGTSAFYFGLGRILILDMAVAVLMSATLFCFILGVREPASAAAASAGGPQAENPPAGPAGPIASPVRAGRWGSRRWFFYGLYAGAALATLTKGLIGFLLTGAVMLLWLVVANQWKRLRPLYLPSGILIFLAIAAPWHALAAERNPAWAHFYFIHEHWERFTTTEHGRYGPWWYFLPIVLGGLFPWVGFLWPAAADALRGGWKARARNAEAWFFAVWAVFIFGFFSKSQSKLPAYILPVFPPLAVLLGVWLAKAENQEDSARLRPGLRVFSAGCGILAVAVVAAVARPGLIIRDAAQARELQPYAFVLAPVLLGGGILSLWLARLRGVRASLVAVVVTMALSFGVLDFAQADIQPVGTQSLALIVKERAKPGDRVYHYLGFFHEFLFYAQREVGLVSYQDELEPMNDPAARSSGRFIDVAEFRRQWRGPGRIWAVAQKDNPLVRQLLADPTFAYHLIGETRRHVLISNRP